MENAGYPTGVDVERGTQGEVDKGVVYRWLRGEGQAPTIAKLRPVAELLDIPLNEMMVAAGLVAPHEVGLADNPKPPAPHPTLEELIQASPDYSPEMKDAMSALLAAARDEDKRRQSTKHKD